jgi:hypothetical protein
MTYSIFFFFPSAFCIYDFSSFHLPRKFLEQMIAIVISAPVKLKERVEFVVPVRIASEEKERINKT